MVLNEVPGPLDEPGLGHRLDRRELCCPAGEVVATDMPWTPGWYGEMRGMAPTRSAAGYRVVVSAGAARYHSRRVMRPVKMCMTVLVAAVP